MSGFFRGVALLVAVTCAVWVAVLWRWQATSRDMTTGDIVVYLGLLPLVVFTTALLLRWAWRGAQERHDAAQAAAAAAPAGAAPTPPTGDAAARHATVQLLSAKLLTAAGAAPAELDAAAKDGRPRPDLDAELRDDDGLPVFTARIPDLDLDAIADDVDAALATLRERSPDAALHDVPDHVRRALAALHAPLLDAAGAIAAWADCFDAKAGSAERRLRVLLGLPAAWTPAEQELARELAGRWLADERATGLPPGRIAPVTLAAPGDDLLVQADRLMQTLAREQRDDVLLIAACHSDIGEAALAALERTGQLFSAQRRPKGRMPGEAAAALLLAPATWPALPEADAPAPHLHRPAALRRDKPVDAPGRVTSDVVREAMTQALATGPLGADAIGALACDADQHTPRGAELHGGTLALLPQLDALEDLRLLGTVTGGVGAVGPLLAVACAAELARASEKPCLVATLGDPQARLALVVRPAAPVPASTPASAPSPTGSAA